MDYLASNSQSYWTRLEQSTRCFELESNLTESVHVVDIPVTIKPQPINTTAPLRKQECTSLEVLKNYISDRSNARYACRLM
jgi:hypothetical protein